MRKQLLKLNDVAIGYDGQPLYRQLNMSIGEGELVALTGANGAGKSTLLNTLTGRLKPLQGSVDINGRLLNSLSSKELSRLVSIVTTDRNMAGGLTVEELVGLGRQPYTGFFGRMGENDKRIVKESLNAVGMAGFCQRDVASLSDGERQKVMIARALTQETPLMMLDEPTSFLDVASRLETFQLLAQLAHRQQKAIIVSTHDLATALRLADRLWLMTECEARERQIVDGSPKELIANGALSSMFPGRQVRFDPDLGDFLPL